MRKNLVTLLLALFIGGAAFLIYYETVTSPFLINKGEGDKNEVKKTIAIIDSGANLEDVNYNMDVKIKQYNVLDESTDITDTAGRGTDLFSALYNHIYSMNKANDVLLIKAFTKTKSLKNDDIVKALDYARKAKVSIITLGFEMEKDKKIDKAINDCLEDGITIVAAKNHTESYPSSIKNVISVSPIDKTVESDVKVDGDMSIICKKTKCKKKTSNAINTAYTAGHLIDYKDPLDESINLILRPSFSVVAEHRNEVQENK